MASAKPAARPARGAVSIGRCDRGLQRFVAKCARWSGRLMSVCGHATCADRDVHFRMRGCVANPLATIPMTFSHSTSRHSNCPAIDKRRTPAPSSRSPITRSELAANTAC